MILIVFMAGCASVSYYPATSKTLIPKPKDSIVVVLPEDFNQPYSKIGHLVVSGGNAPITQMSEQAVINEFYKQARKRGADGVINTKTNIAQVTRYWQTPPQTTYHSVSGYTNGNFAGTGFSGNYNSTTTTMIPETTPGTVVPLQIIIPTVQGDLVVFEGLTANLETKRYEYQDNQITYSTEPQLKSKADYHILKTTENGEIIIDATDKDTKPKKRFDVFKAGGRITAFGDPNKIIGQEEVFFARIVITQTTPNYSVGSLVCRLDGSGSKPEISEITKDMVCRKTIRKTLKAEKKIYKYQKKALKREYKLMKLKAKSGTYEALDKSIQDANGVSSIKAGMMKVEKK